MPQTETPKEQTANSEIELNFDSSNSKKISKSTIILILLFIFVVLIFSTIALLLIQKDKIYSANNSVKSSNSFFSNKNNTSSSSESTNISSSETSNSSESSSFSSEISSSVSSSHSALSIDYSENKGKYIYFKYPKGWSVDVWPSNGVASYNKEVYDNETNSTKTISCSFSGIRKVIAKSSNAGYEVGTVHPFVTSGKSDNNCICDNDCGGFGCTGEEYTYEINIDQKNNLVKVVAKHNDAYTNTGSDFTKSFNTKNIFSKYFPESNSYAYYVNFNEGGHFITFADKDGNVNINSFYPQSKSVCAYYGYNDIVNLDKLIQNTTSISVLTDSIGGNVTYNPSSYYDAQNYQNLTFTISQKTMQNAKLTCSSAQNQEEFEACLEPLQIYLQSAKRYK